MYDKLLHSSVGLGSYLTAIIAYLLWWIGAIEYIILAPLMIAIGKETIDRIRGSRFDVGEVIATLNPMIVIKWYLEKFKN